MKTENPWIEICPGIRRRTHAHGRAMYQMVAELTAGSRMPEHRHSQEQIVPVFRPALEERHIFGFHELIADFQVGIDPARDVAEAIGHHPAFLAKSAIDGGSIFELLDDHVQHGSILPSSRAQSRDPEELAFKFSQRNPSTSLRMTESAQLLVCFGEGVDGELQILAGMRRAHLRPNARCAMWYYGIEEANDVNAFLQHAGSKLLRLGGVANHNWNDWMDSSFDRESTFR